MSKTKNKPMDLDSRGRANPAFQPILVALGTSISEARRARNVTQEELAEKAGLSLCSLGYIEQGRRGPSVLSLLLIARALRVPVSETMMCLDDLPP